MTWDSQNRMASCTKAGVTSTYTYGADGLRRTSTVTPTGGGAVTTGNVYDGTMLVQEQRGAGAFATYLNGARGPECRVDETQPAAETGYTSSKSLFQRGPAKWYVYDGLGSVTGELSVTGAAPGSGTPPYLLTSSPKYDVYGAVRGNAGAASSRQGFVGGLGHVSDSETGLVYMRARYYDPSNGRFVSEDPAGHGINWFLYADDDPVNTVDATGKEGIGECAFSMAISGTLGGLENAAMDCMSQSLRNGGAIDSSEVSESFFGGFAVGLLGGAGYVIAATSKIAALTEIAGALACVVSAKNFFLAAAIFSDAGFAGGAVSVGIHSIIAHNDQVGLMLMSTEMEDM